MFRFCQVLFSQLFESLLHRIEGIYLAGQNGEFDRFMNRVRQAISAIIQLEEFTSGKYLLYLHLIQGQGSGLIHA